jgi:hypothetical protein
MRNVLILILVVCGIVGAMSMPLVSKGSPPHGMVTPRMLWLPVPAQGPDFIPCDVSTATSPVHYFPALADGLYQAHVVAGGQGTITLVAGASSAVVTVPCNPCVLTAPAPPGIGMLNVSLTFAAGKCPGPGLAWQDSQIAVGP